MKSKFGIVAGTLGQRLRGQVVAGLVVAGATLAAFSAQSAVINFDDVPDATVITNQYPGATFSSDPGSVVETTAQPAYTQISQPNFICTFTGGAIDCSHDVFVTFASPVSGLSFLSTGANDAGPAQGNVDVFESGVLAGSVPIPGIGAFLTAQFIDLSAFHHVTSIEIDHVIDPFGLGYDDFKFTPDSVGDRGGGVPEPASWSLMICGFGAIGATLRRRRSLFAIPT
jgi:hypothetical protein